MSQPVITCIVNGNAYKLTVNDRSAISKMQAADRQQLIALLESIKAYESSAQLVVEQTLGKLSQPTAANSTSVAKPVVNVTASDLKPERIGEGDIDALMSRLILEERQNKKPMLTKQKLFKYVLGFIIFITLLTIIF